MPTAPAEVPPGVVTVTLTTPVTPAGAVTVIEVAEVKVRPVAATVPNLTEVAPTKLVPEMVTDVPPAPGPVIGLRAVTVGMAA